MAESTSQGIALRRAGLAGLLLCALAATPHGARAQGQDAALSFSNADIESVIKAVGHYTGVTFIIDPRVKGNINLVSEKSISKAQAFALLTSTLRLHGYTVVAGDGYAKVVPEGDAKLQSSPTQVTSGPMSVKGDQIATQIFRLNYESANSLVTVLRPLISPNNTVNANVGNNSLVITDYADNLTRLGKIISALDTPASGDVDVVPVRHAIASDIVAMVQRLLESGSADAGRVNLLADSRTNSVVLRAPSAARANLAKSLIAKLDQPTTQPGNVHVVYLKNADATKLAQTLRAVISADASSGAQSAQTPALSGNSALNAGPGVQQPTSLSPQPQQLSSGGAAGFIQADASTNTLIITANEAVYRNLRAVIEQLDVRRAQVYIESLIVEVSADKAADFGIQWLGATGNSKSTYRVGGASSSSLGGATNNITTVAGLAAGGKLTSAAPSIGGLTLGVFKQINGQVGLGALAHALESDANTNILSTPNLITLDNEEAKIIVGKNVPFLTGSYSNQGGGSTSAGVNPFNTVERKDVGLQLKVRPQVSEGGTVKLAIYQESSSILSTADSSGGIITNKRSIETNVLADDGQIIVLGGLIEDSLEDKSDKVSGLADLPLIGNLFRYQTRSRKKTNLMVFLRPTVIRSNEQSTNLMAERYNAIRATEEASQPPKSFMLPDTGTPVLPPLVNGRPEGGMLSRPGGQVAAPATAQPQPQSSK